MSHPDRIHEEECAEFGAEKMTLRVVEGPLVSSTSTPRDFVTPELLRRAAAGDEKAWEQVVELLTPQITRTIGRYVRSPSEHADIAQEVFIKLYLKLEQHGGDRSFHSWVYRITLNACHDWLRRLQRRPVSSGGLPDESIEDTSPHTGERNLHAKDAMTLVDALLARLSANEQIVIRLLDLEEHDVASTAMLTGWSKSRVKVTAMRARRKLRMMATRLSRTNES